MDRSPGGSRLERVVLVSLDTLRSDCVAANPLKLWPGEHRVSVELETPVLDDLVRDGVFFANCVSAAPYTSASHGTLLTGKWPLRHGVFELYNRRLKGPTIFDHAKRLGYTTILKTDFPLILGEHLNFTQGVDRYLVEDDEGFLDALATKDPVVGLVHFGGIHLPYGFHNLRFGGDTFVAKVAELEAELPTSLHVERKGAPGETDLLVRYKRAVQYLYANQDYDRIFDLYLEGVNHHLRTRFGPFLERLLDALAGTRFLLVAFGDHGEEYSPDSYGHQNSLAEGVLRVPMIFYGEGCAPAVHLDRMRTVDLTPTLLELLGDPTLPRRRLDGVSLADTVTSRAAYRVRPAFAQSYIAENGAYLAFMRRLLLTGRKTGSLKHVLYKECAYDADAKFSRRLYDYLEDETGWRLRPAVEEAALERIETDGTLRMVDDAETEAQLRELLAAYNNRLPAEGSEAGGDVPMTAAIRRQLEAMGYAV